MRRSSRVRLKHAARKLIIASIVLCVGLLYAYPYRYVDAADFLTFLRDSQAFFERQIGATTHTLKSNAARCKRALSYEQARNLERFLENFYSKESIHKLKQY